MMTNQKKLVLALCASLTAIALTACGTVKENTSSSDPAEIVAARVEARWKLLIEGRVEAAYDYLSPASRSTLSLITYKARTKPGMWREAKAKSVTCEADVCKAKVWLKYDIQKITGLELDFEESWVKEGGNWWYVQKK